MSAILDMISAAPRTQPTAGVALICDHAMTDSLMAEGRAPGTCEAEIYAGVAAAVLTQSRFSVVLHSRSRPAKAALGAAIERGAALSPSAPGRLQVIAAVPLEAVLPGVDLLVSFASPTLIAGCRNGLKPVQIGRAVIGSAAFSHVFPDIASFADALATGRLAGRLTLQEYEQFEEFCRRVTGRDAAAGRHVAGNRPRAAWRLARDPINRECRQPDGTWRFAMRAIASAIVNPLAAWRLVRASFGPTGTR